MNGKKNGIRKENVESEEKIDNEEEREKTQKK